MSNPSKGARLYLRAASGPRKAVWLIRDGDKIVSTGCPADERDAAEQRLAAYIGEKHRPSRQSGRDPAKIEIADVLSIYMADRGGAVARPKELGHRLIALGRFFRTQTLDKINGKLCRSYVKHRVDEMRRKHAAAVVAAAEKERNPPAPFKPSESAARRELEDLRAAINHHRAEGLCAEVVDVILPEKSQPRERWLTRDEAAHLLWQAWKGGQGKRKHVARFILVALYTGTRATAICEAAVRPTVGRGYVDLERGVFYRKAAGKRETKKRQPPVSLHPKLLTHLRLWRAADARRATRAAGHEVDGPNAVLSWRGQPIGRMAKAFRNAARAAGFDDVTPHILRHTAITWAMQNGADRFEAAGMFGVTMEVLERVYAHHRPDQGASVHRAISKKSAQPVRQPVRQTTGK